MKNSPVVGNPQQEKRKKNVQNLVRKSNNFLPEQSSDCCLTWFQMSELAGVQENSVELDRNRWLSSAFCVCESGGRISDPIGGLKTTLKIGVHRRQQDPCFGIKTLRGSGLQRELSWSRGGTDWSPRRTPWSLDLPALQTEPSQKQKKKQDYVWDIYPTSHKTFELTENCLRN